MNENVLVATIGGSIAVLWMMVRHGLKNSWSSTKIALNFFSWLLPVLFLLGLHSLLLRALGINWAAWGFTIMASIVTYGLIFALMCTKRDSA